MLTYLIYFMFISDNHGHVNPVNGLGPKIVAKRFAEKGGSFMVIVSLLPSDFGLNAGDINDVEKLYRLTIESSRLVSESGVKSVPVIGIHPAECYKLLERGWSINDVRNHMIKVIDAASQFIKRGEAIGIGEIGRPHWDVNNDIIELCNDIILYAMETARDINAVVHLHLERKGRETVDSIKILADKANIAKEKVVLHHAAPDMVGIGASYGFSPSVPIGRKGEFDAAIQLGPIFVVESDFADDPKRTGSVIPPWTLAKKLKNYVERGIVREEFIDSICKTNMEKIYGITL